MTDTTTREMLTKGMLGVRETIEEYARQIETGKYGYTVEASDEPITMDGTPISEYPLEIVDQRGREFAVVISTGGPHIEVVADGGYNARLEGYWGGEHVTMSGDYFSTFLDYFIDRD